MKLHSEFLSHENNGEAYLVPSVKVPFAGVVRGNKTLGMILELLRNDTTEQEIVNAIRKDYDAPEGVVERDVHTAIENLRSVGAIVD